MVHPGGPADGVAGAFDFQFPRHSEPRKGNVVRRLARAFRFLAHPVFSMNHRRLDRIEPQMESKLVGRGFDRLVRGR